MLLKQKLLDALGNHRGLIQLGEETQDWPFFAVLCRNTSWVIGLYGCVQESDVDCMVAKGQAHNV